MIGDETAGYCAPEVVVGKYSLKSDVYNYGVVYMSMTVLTLCMMEKLIVITLCACAKE